MPDNRQKHNKGEAVSFGEVK